MPAGETNPVYAPYVEHVPPTTAGEIVLLKTERQFYVACSARALVGADGGAIKIEHTRSKVEAEVDLLLHPPEKSAEDRVH